MYTHRFPGIIKHTSFSKRILPEASTDANKESLKEHQQTPPTMRGRESSRLAIVYKVVQEEHVSYHTRIYHFGVFQHHAELRGNNIQHFSDLEWD
jgi:pSer/pThr/pTyr-binding forkhead associated (FHA) protein